MHIGKVVEVIASSEKSFDDPIQKWHLSSLKKR